jgi:hypothetical protein
MKHAMSAGSLAYVRHHAWHDHPLDQTRFKAEHVAPKVALTTAN